MVLCLGAHQPLCPAHANSPSRFPAKRRPETCFPFSSPPTFQPSTFDYQPILSPTRQGPQPFFVFNNLRTLLSFFAPAQTTTPFFSCASALFCKNTRGVGTPLTFSETLRAVSLRCLMSPWGEEAPIAARQFVRTRANLADAFQLPVSADYFL